MRNPKNKFIVFFITLILIFTSLTLQAQECGDVNSTNVTDIVDALLIAQYYVGLPVSLNTSVGDVDQSGIVDIVDAMLVAQYYVGIISSLNCDGANTPDPTATPAIDGNAVYTTSEGHIYRDGRRINLFGLNWFGMETSDHIVHGLWTGRQLDDFLGDITSKGFNALRLPLSPEVINSGYAIDSGPYNGADCEALCGKDGRAALEYTLERAQAFGMYVLLDFHTCNPANLGSGLPGTPIGCPGYSLSSWIQDLQSLAQLSLAYSNVVGIDLCNEPYALSYNEWANLVSEGGEAVLNVNPDTTIWVEGVGNNSATPGYPANWGQNLFGAGSIAGIPDNKLVFSPHSYGPAVAAMDYFSAPNFPENMPEVWDGFFGYLHDQGFSVVTGEFGGTYETNTSKARNDKLWQDSFVSYLIDKGMTDSFYWCVNPNSGDTGGVYEGDWKTWVQPKVTLLQRLMN